MRLGCCAVMLMSGCSHSSTPAKAPGNVTRIDDMIVRLDDVRRIAKADDLAPHPEADLHKPAPSDASAPGPCGVVGHNELTFGSNWTEFRSAGYHGVTDDIEPLGRAHDQRSYSGGGAICELRCGAGRIP